MGSAQTTRRIHQPHQDVALGHCPAGRGLLDGSSPQVRTLCQRRLDSKGRLNGGGRSRDRGGYRTNGRHPGLNWIHRVIGALDISDDRRRTGRELAGISSASVQPPLRSEIENGDG